MASTLTSILVHVTFSTKNREPTIPADMLPDLFAYAGGVCRDMCRCAATPAYGPRDVRLTLERAFALSARGLLSVPWM